MPKALWLTDVLKDAGLKVKEERGWKSRGHGSMKAFHGILLHHTAGAKTGNFPSLNVVKNGRPGLGGPLANLGLARDGTWYIIAAGKAWHAGRGKYSWDNINIRSGNDYLIGIEAENTGVANDKPWPKKQVDSYVKGVAALLKHLELPPERAIGHKEWTTRKIDPSFDMEKFRHKLKAHMEGEEPDDYWPIPSVEDIQERLIVWEYDLGSSGADGDFGPKTKTALKAFQKRFGFEETSQITSEVWEALKKNKWNIHTIGLVEVPPLPDRKPQPEPVPLPDPKPIPEDDDRDDNAHYARGILVGLGWTPIQAAAIIGNAMVESGEELYTGSTNNSGTPYGIMKWWSDRKEKLREFARENDRDMNDLETQVRFIDWELRNTNKDVYKRLKDSFDMESALRASMDYVRPHGYNPNNPERSSKWKERVLAGYSLL
jgi:hypothetical protein